MLVRSFEPEPADIASLDHGSSVSGPSSIGPWGPCSAQACHSSRCRSVEIRGSAPARRADHPGDETWGGRVSGRPSELGHLWVSFRLALPTTSNCQPLADPPGWQRADPGPIPAQDDRRRDQTRTVSNRHRGRSTSLGPRRSQARLDPNATVVKMSTVKTSAISGGRRLPPWAEGPDTRRPRGTLGRELARWHARRRCLAGAPPAGAAQGGGHALRQVQDRAETLTSDAELAAYTETGALPPIAVEMERAPAGALEVVPPRVDVMMERECLNAALYGKAPTGVTTSSGSGSRTHRSCSTDGAPSAREPLSVHRENVGSLTYDYALRYLRRSARYRDRSPGTER